MERPTPPTHVAQPEAAKHEPANGVGQPAGYAEHDGIVESATAPAAKPPRWSGRKTAIAAALAIGFASAGTAAAATLLPAGTGAGSDGGPGGTRGGHSRQWGGQPGQFPQGQQGQFPQQGQQGQLPQGQQGQAPQQGQLQQGQAPQQGPNT